DQYGTVSKLARGLPTGTAVVGVGSRWSLFALPRPRLAGMAGILVHSTGGAINDMSWASATPVATAARRHGSNTLEQFVLYRVIGAANPSDAAFIPLPRPH
ncbi:MAG TPA: hypothetical protein VH855_09605, partial [Acetobacteraceae bacterium]